VDEWLVFVALAVIAYLTVDDDATPDCVHVGVALGNDVGRHRRQRRHDGVAPRQRGGIDTLGLPVCVQIVDVDDAPWRPRYLIHDVFWVEGFRLVASAVGGRPGGLDAKTVADPDDRIRTDRDDEDEKQRDPPLPEQSK